MAIDSYMAFMVEENKFMKAESSIEWADKSNLSLEKQFIDFDARSTGNELFEIDSYSFSIEQQLNIGSQSSGTGAGRVKFGEFTVERKVDMSSPIFYRMACAGQPFQRVSLLLRKGAGDGGSGLTFVRFDFRLVAISKVDWSHDDESPKETLTLEYGAMRIGYTPQLASGKMGGIISAGWNRVNNKQDDSNKPLGQQTAGANVTNG